MKSALIIIVALLLMTALLNGVGVVGFTYAHVVENDPLESPVTVTDIKGDLLTLADGRVLRVSQAENFPEAIRKSGNRIEIDQVDGDLLLFVKRRGYCGSPWATSFRIPLIAEDVDVYHRVALMAHVEIVDATR